jgi:hypothetical protein
VRRPRRLIINEGTFFFLILEELAEFDGVLEVHFYFLVDELEVLLEEGTVAPLLLVQIVLDAEVPEFVEGLEVAAQLIQVVVVRKRLLEDVLPVVERLHRLESQVDPVLQNRRLSRVLLHLRVVPQLPNRLKLFR